jgi:hypothetical protein
MVLNYILFTFSGTPPPVDSFILVFSLFLSVLLIMSAIIFLYDFDFFGICLLCPSVFIYSENVLY